jgi:glucose-6-phosphate 1-epimerase
MTETPGATVAGGLSSVPVPGTGGLPKLVLVAAGGARAEIYLHGAHVTSWHPAGDGDERLFLSRRSRFGPGAAIRGGIPVSFPQFADQGPLPHHGFARDLEWRPVLAYRSPSGAAHAVLRLVDTGATRALWPHPFIAELAVTIHARALEVALAIENTGPAAFEFTVALHTYLRVLDIGDVRVTGLQGARYRDKVRGADDCLETAAALAVPGEIDRVYHAAPDALAVREPGRVTSVRATGFPDTVVWNPGPVRARDMDDMEPGGETRMVCVEAAASRAPLVLPSGAQWRGTQTLTAH